MLLKRRNVEREAEGYAAEKLKAEGFEEISENSSLKDLKSIAKENGIEGYSKMSKEELQKAIKDVIHDGC